MENSNELLKNSESESPETKNSAAEDETPVSEMTQQSETSDAPEENIENTENTDDTDGNFTADAPISDKKKARASDSETGSAIKGFFSKVKGKIPLSISMFTAVAAVLLAIVITFMATFTLLDRKYQKDYNDLLTSVSGENYYTLEYVKQLFAQYYLGDVSELSDNEILDAMIRTYIMQTGDRYSYYWNQEEYADYMSELQGEGVGIGVLVSWNASENAIEVLYVYDESPAAVAGIQPGDRIVAVGDERLADIGYDDALTKMKGEIGSQVEITVLRNGEEKSIATTRQEFQTVSVISKMLSDDKTAYIRILQFDGTTTEQFAKAYLELKDKAECFIFDVRDNPGGALDSVMGVLSFLIGDDIPIVEISDKSGTVSVEKSNREIYCTDEYSSSIDKDFVHGGRTVILTNKGTASAGELFTSVMHDVQHTSYEDVFTVGITTYGKGVMQRTYLLPNGGALKLTFSKYTAPGVENYDGVGISPDFEQALEGDAAGKNILSLTELEDTQLQKALHVLYGESAEELE